MLIKRYIDLRKHLNAACLHADAGDWEACLAEIDDAKAAVIKLEREPRLLTGRVDAARIGHYPWGAEA